TLALGGAPASLQMRSARVAGTINPPSNVPAPPPAQLAAGLTVLETITANGTGQGLCGNVTVASLAQIPAPQTLCTGGNSACATCPGSNTYTYCGAGLPVTASCNSLLDVLVGGCGLIPIAGNCIVQGVNATQPDVPAGATVQQLTLNAM